MSNIVGIKNGTGRLLAIGECDSKIIDKCLEANQCKCHDTELDYCDDCDHTGYIGDFTAYWSDNEGNEIEDSRNVYEWIHY